MNADYRGPMRFAHRGVAQAAVENTLVAFQAAYDAGLEGIELDIRLCRDGEVVICHDHHLARLTCGHPTGFSIRHLRDLDWEKLSRIELPYALHTLPEKLPPHTEIEELTLTPNRVLGDYQAAYKTETRMAHLMRFVDFDRWLSRLDRKPIVEVEFCEDGLMPRMLQILDASPNRENYILFSGQREIIDDMQRVCRLVGKPKGVRLGANIRFLNNESKEYIRGLDLFEVGLNDWAYDCAEVSYLNDQGIQVLSNLGDYPAWWTEICKNGSLGFKTNYSGAFLAWWKEQNTTA